MTFDVNVNVPGRGIQRGEATIRLEIVTDDFFAPGTGFIRSIASANSGITLRVDGLVASDYNESSETRDLISIESPISNAASAVTLFDFKHSSNIIGATGELVNGKDGFLYGHSTLGGAANAGTVFKLKPSGDDFQILHSFAGSTNIDLPNTIVASLVDGEDGHLYGIQQIAVNDHRMSIYRLNKSSGIIEFIFNNGNPESTLRLIDYGLCLGPDGYLYGVGFYNRNYSDGGQIFRIHRDGAELVILHSFEGNSGRGATEGYQPAGRLAYGDDGYLYGVNGKGGAFGAGTIFRLRADGSDFSVIKDFPGTWNTSATGHDYRLLLSVDGWIYGAWPLGGDYNYGAVYKVRRDGSEFAVLQSFSPYRDYGRPTSGLVERDGGKLFGVALHRGLYAVDRIGTNSIQLVSPLSFWNRISSPISMDDGHFYFAGDLVDNGHGEIWRSRADLAVPEALYSSSSPKGRRVGIISLSDAEYVVVYESENSIYADDSWSQFGLLERINIESGESRVIFRFTIPNIAYAYGVRFRLSNVSMGSDGYLYGAVISEYSANSFLYRIKPDGVGFSILKEIGYNDSNGRPITGLTDGHDSYHYGVTEKGSIYRINAEGEYMVLYQEPVDHFNVFQDSLVLGGDGRLYGLVRQYTGLAHSGVIFSASREGDDFRIIRTFTSERNLPSDLIEGHDGRLYGLPDFFSMQKDGSDFQELYRFPFGYEAVNNLVENSAGLFFASARGRNWTHQIFRLDTILNTFDVVYEVNQDDGKSSTFERLISGDYGEVRVLRNVAGKYHYGSLIQVRLNELAED